MLTRLGLLGLLLGVAMTARAQQPSPPPVPPATGFVTGFNQAWIHNDYGSQWVTRFDPAEARRLLEATAGHGGRVLRMWLFEGTDPEGVIWDGQAGAAQPGHHRNLPTGIDPAKLRNLETFLGLARRAGVKVYITFFDANIIHQEGPGFDDRRAEWWNVLNDKYGAGSAFLKNVVAPVMAVAARNSDAVFGVDLCNEVNAFVRAHWFEGGWTGAARFVGTWRAFIRGRASIPVSASLGYAEAVPDLLAQRLPPAIVDFYDFHVYADSGSIPLAAQVRSFARSCGRPIYLGEFGQLSKAFDDVLQQRITASFIRGARDLGLAGAFPWRLSDIRPGFNPEARLSYEAGGKWRPAMETFRQVSGE